MPACCHLASTRRLAVCCVAAESCCSHDCNRAVVCFSFSVSRSKASSATWAYKDWCQSLASLISEPANLITVAESSRHAQICKNTSLKDDSSSEFDHIPVCSGSSPSVKMLFVSAHASVACLQPQKRCCHLLSHAPAPDSCLYAHTKVESH